MKIQFTTEQGAITILEGPEPEAVYLVGEEKAFDELAAAYPALADAVPTPLGWIVATDTVADIASHHVYMQARREA